MNFFQKIVLGFSILAVVSFSANAQESNSVSDLVKQGVQLTDQGKYAEAIGKYQEALKIEPEITRLTMRWRFL